MYRAGESEIRLQCHPQVAPQVAPRVERQEHLKTLDFPCCHALQVRNEKAAQRVSFGAGYPADVHAAVPADVRGQKLRIRSGAQKKSGKNKHFGVDVHDPKVRTSMTPGRLKKKLGSEKLRAKCSFPIKDSPLKIRVSTQMLGFTSAVPRPAMKMFSIISHAAPLGAGL